MSNEIYEEYCKSEKQYIAAVSLNRRNENNRIILSRLAKIINDEKTLKIIAHEAKKEYECLMKLKKVMEDNWDKYKLNNGNQKETM